MGSKINKIHYRNYAMIPNFDLENITGINLIIGANGTGKTFLLKSIYSAVRTFEEYHRGDDIRTVSDILSEKIRWTFQVEKIGDIVKKGCSDPLEFQMSFDGGDFSYFLSQSTTTKITSVTPSIETRNAKSIFIPAKEVLSLYSVILKSREIDQSFGFDDTYYDLVRALRIAPRKGKNFRIFSIARKSLSNVISGKVDVDEKSGKWYYKDDKKYRYSIAATSEGIKKISILDRLLANGYLSNSSIVFIDEVESALHPDAICKFLDMIGNISSEMGIQFFITSHSYFVVKKLYLIAKKQKGLVTCISLEKKGECEPCVCDLHDGIPNNSIIDTSIELYDEEITEAFDGCDQ